MDTARIALIRKLLEGNPGLRIEDHMGQYLGEQLDKADGPAQVEVLGVDARIGVPRRATVDLATIRRQLLT